MATQSRPTMRKAYDAIPGVKLDFGDEISLTRQDAKDECDINQIVDKFQRTGVIDHRNKYEAKYGFADSNDLHQAMNLITEAQQMFDELPSKARKRFNNDPGQFLDFVQDPANINEMETLGLATVRERELSPLEAAAQAKSSAASSGESGGNASEASEPQGGEATP